MPQWPRTVPQPVINTGSIRAMIREAMIKSDFFRLINKLKDVIAKVDVSIRKTLPLPKMFIIWKFSYFD